MNTVVNIPAATVSAYDMLRQEIDINEKLISESNKEEVSTINE